MMDRLHLEQVPKMTRDQMTEIITSELRGTTTPLSVGEPKPPSVSPDSHAVPAEDLDLVLLVLRKHIAEIPRSNRKYVKGRTLYLGCLQSKIADATFTDMGREIVTALLPLLHRFFPNFPVSSIAINYNTRSTWHSDGRNKFLSAIMSLGMHTGGNLLVLQETGTPGLQPDQLIIKDRITIFDGQKLHCNTDYIGEERWSCVFFVHHTALQLPLAIVNDLHTLGFLIPQRATPWSVGAVATTDADDAHVATASSSAGGAGDFNDEIGNEGGHDDPFDDGDDGDEGCDDDGNIVLNIEHMLQGVIQVSVFPTDSVITVKGYIRNKCNINRSRQHLVLDDEELDDNGTVEDYGLTKESNLKLVLGVFAAAGGVKKTIQKNKISEKKMKGLQQDLEDGAELLAKMVVKDPELKFLTATIKKTLDAPNALKDAVFKVTLPDLMEFKEEYVKTTNTKTRGDMMAALLFGKGVIDELDQRAISYGEIKDLLTTIAHVVYERNYAGTHKSNKNTFVDLMTERASSLAGVKKKSATEATHEKKGSGSF